MARNQNKINHIGPRQGVNLHRITYVFVLAACLSLLPSCQSRSDSQVDETTALGEAAVNDGATDIAQAPPPSDKQVNEARALQVKAVDQLVGGWRSVGTNADYQKNYFFAMMPSVPAPGERFVAYDLVANRVICCAVVEGGELSGEYLTNTLYIPGAWVNDLLNEWNSDEAPYRPKVVELQMVDALGSYEFLVGKRKSDGILMTLGGGFGGLLLPENSEVVGPAELRIGGRSYAVNWSGHFLADDDGVVHTYVLKSGDGEELIVEVPYGTN